MSIKQQVNESLNWSLWDTIRSVILVVTFTSACIFGPIGYLKYPLDGEPVYWTNAIYHSAQLFLLHTPHFGKPVPWELEVARLFAATSTILILVNAALLIYRKQRIGFVLWRRSDHIIVCGIGRRGVYVVEKLHEKGEKIVAIDINPEPEIIDRMNKMRIPLITGDATRREILLKAKINKAVKLYAFCREDTTNFSIADEVHHATKLDKKVPECIIHINDTELRYALQTNHQGVQTENPGLQFVDGYGPVAISVLQDRFPLDHDGIKPGDEKQVHLIIVGLGSMGKAIAVKAAQLGQFANRKKMRVSVIDLHAKHNLEALFFHHPYLTEVADFSFYEQEIHSRKSKDLINSWCEEKNTLVNIVICFDNPSLVYDTTFNLLPEFNQKNVKVAVRVNDTQCFDFLLNENVKKMYPDLHIEAFGIEKAFENLVSPEKDEADQFAKSIHANYVKQTREELKDKPDKLAKKEESGALNPWETLREDLRESNRQQAVHIYFKVRAAGYEVVNINDPRPEMPKFEDKMLEPLAIMEHDRWVAERKVNNWTTGSPDNKEKRISESLIDWYQLSPAIQEYDYKAVAQIPLLLYGVGKKMVEKSK
jgi:voltage-gated potassium channel Kch